MLDQIGFVVASSAAPVSDRVYQTSVLNTDPGPSTSHGFSFHPLSSHKQLLNNDDPRFTQQGKQWLM